MANWLVEIESLSFSRTYIGWEQQKRRRRKTVITTDCAERGLFGVCDLSFVSFFFAAWCFGKHPCCVSVHKSVKYWPGRNLTDCVYSSVKG